MKRQEIRNVESLLAATFRRPVEVYPDDTWQAGIMTAVRRGQAAARPVIAPLMSLHLMWRLAMCSIVAALVCGAVYVMSPAQTTTVVSGQYDVPLDSFESAVTIVAKL